MNNSQIQQTAFQLVSAAKTGKPDSTNLVPHCTNPECPFFSHDNPHDTSWYTEHNTYCTKAFGTVQRYRCRHCGKTFSTQSFSIDYWVQHPVDYLPLIQSLVSTSGQGNMTRFTNLRYEVIQNRYERLCRLFLALHANLRTQLNLDENIVLDGFESFSCSQFFPNNINILAGENSEIIYGMSFAQLRRKGRMTGGQKLKRSELEARYGKAPRKAIELAVASLIKDFCKLLSDRNIPMKIMKTDEHKAYPRALKRVPESAEYLRHEQYPSATARTPCNPLFPVNYVDRQFRKDQANHVRETVQFARCPAAMMVRLSIYQMYHNYLIPRRVKEQRKGNWQTRAELQGLGAEKVLATLGQHLGKRVFLRKLDLWETERMTWLQEWRNEGVCSGRRIPKFILV